MPENGATIVRLASFNGGESEVTQKLFEPLSNNLIYPGKCELAQKLGNVVRIESCMLETETEEV